jgi:7-keto-8-aminopelargonate synthetase-like enzyme
MANSSPLAGRTISGPVSARITIDGKEYVNFFGSGYLALSHLPEVRDAVLRTLQQGTPFARQLPAAAGGVDPIFDAIEQLGATACGTEASVYFSSGYFIGPVGLSSMDDRFDSLFLDETAHYNLKDAAKLSGLSTFEFAHCDADSLRNVLKQHVRANQRPLVVTDGVFATSGRVSPLDEYASVLGPYDGRMFVDESHAFGVVGENGRGAAEHCGVEHLAATGTTLSKAYCAQGALVGCSKAGAERLRLQPPIRGACAGSPLSAVAATESLNYVAKRPQIRKDLRAMTDYLRARLRGLGLDVIESPASIVSFQWGKHADMQALQRRVFERGIHIYHSAYIGAGPEGMIRCAVFRDHSREDIDALIAALG